MPEMQQTSRRLSLDIPGRQLGNIIRQKVGVKWKLKLKIKS
nr:MAG TPA: hypothetical protein [Caudoviricetes sp.]